MKLGKTELKHGLFLAPMAGFSDRAMRLVCHNMGAEYSFTEMVSAKAVDFGDKKTSSLARVMSDEGKVGVQIFGSSAEIMARSAERLSHGEAGGVPPFSIDINMGCPVHKVFSNGEGSALMKNPDLIYKIVKAVSENTDLPCTVKMRAGIDSYSINAVECALAAEAGGVSAITVHGRTRAEMYSGKCDLNIISDVKKSVHIPVVANGDITNADEAVDVLKKTGADGIMIGRGAIGNPFVFSEILARLDGDTFTPPTFAERVKVALFQLSTAVFEKGEEIAVREARKQIALYLRSFRGASELRSKINLASTYAEVEAILYCAMEKHENEK